MAVWATEAFFRYGGEPEMVQPAPLIPSQPFHQQPYSHPAGGIGATPTPLTPIAGSGGLLTPTQSGYHPQGLGGAKPGPQGLYGPGPIGISTPQTQPPNFNRTLGGAVVGPELKKSGRHLGMCRYLARLLRPLWEEKIVEYHPPERTHSGEQVRWDIGGVVREEGGCVLTVRVLW